VAGQHRPRELREPLGDRVGAGQSALAGGNEARVVAARVEGRAARRVAVHGAGERIERPCGGAVSEKIARDGVSRGEGRGAGTGCCELRERRLELCARRLRAVRLLARFLVEGCVLEGRLRLLHVAGDDGPEQLRERLSGAIRAMRRRFRIRDAPGIVPTERHACTDRRRGGEDCSERGNQPS
jgi:hypothetical protein